jgi:putative hydrolase
MSLLEGFSDYVMDEVGRDLVPGVERISAKFHERRNARRSPFERAVMRLTGMDVKLEQYAKGEAFVRGIGEAGGPTALNVLWSGPEQLPRPGEIEDPAAWVRRMGLAAG